MLVGLLGVGQTVLRQQTRGLSSQPVLGALGLDRRQRVLTSLLPYALVATPVAVVTTVAGAIALSPLLPIGSARQIEPSPGVEVNLAVIVIAAALTVVTFLLVVAAVAARSAQRRPPRRPREGAAGRWVRGGLPLTVTIGTGLALDRGRSGSALSVRASMVGAVVAVAAVIGAASFGASLDRLVDTPARYGSPGDLLVADARDELFDQLRADDEVEAVLEIQGFDLLVEGAQRDALTAEVVKGSIGFDFIEGRAPSGPAEVVLGPALAERLDVGIGDPVGLGVDDAPATVVGIALVRGDTSDRYAATVWWTRRSGRPRPTAPPSARPSSATAPGWTPTPAPWSSARTWEVERLVPPRRIQDLAQIRVCPSCWPPPPPFSASPCWRTPSSSPSAAAGTTWPSCGRWAPDRGTPSSPFWP